MELSLSRASRLTIRWSCSAMRLRSESKTAMRAACASGGTVFQRASGIGGVWLIHSYYDVAVQKVQGVSAYEGTLGSPKVRLPYRGDYRLLIDLEDKLQASEIRREILRLDEEHPVVLQEGLPGLQDNWVTGLEGTYCAELVVSLVRPSTRLPVETKTDDANVEMMRLSQTELPPEKPFSAVQSARLRPPGSEWLFMKIYCGPDLKPDLIGREVQDFTIRMFQHDLISSWFFVRFTDPEPHLRLRFSCIPVGRRIPLYLAACDWGSQLIRDGFCVRFSFDTYDREVERYGGEAGLKIAESLFATDFSVYR